MQQSFLLLHQKILNQLYLENFSEEENNIFNLGGIPLLPKILFAFKLSL